jgi:hypothetical protein
VGRTIHRVELASFAVTDHVIGLGREPAVEPRSAFLRLLLPGRAAGELVAVEDARAAARLWRWEPPAGPLEPHDLAGVVPPVLGGGPIAGPASSPGRGPGGYWLFTRSEFLRLGADFGVTDRAPLGLPDSSAGYRFAAADGRTCVLLAPAPPVRGIPPARATWIDLSTGRPAGQRLLELRAGPFVLLPAAAGARRQARP